MTHDCVNLSDIIVLITGAFVAWQAWETRRLAELTRIKDQPLLEVEFPNKGARILLKNIGQSPAYSPSIDSLCIGINERLDFDPLHTSRLPVLPGESREVWMHHLHMTKGSMSSFVDSMPVLKNAVMDNGTPIKIMLQYFDKNGTKLQRTLYIRVGGNKISGDQIIYATTTCE